MATGGSPLINACTNLIGYQGLTNDIELGTTFSMKITTIYTEFFGSA